jgi:uncharacterized protein YyaL (SSP411 family)
MNSTPKRNQLDQEKSPYLLQHKDNPVWWYSWGEAAFSAAKNENKPIFLSIGYSTCYWCHVMEKDSFETQAVADVLNEHFVCIKVDREERPDVDSIYMDVVSILTGHGGWPMSVFLTPDLKPFWGGTFFYQEQFITILKRIAEIWQKERNQAVESAAQITQAINRDIGLNQEIEVGKDFLNALLASEASNFDANHGGFGAAPKFPPAMAIGFLLRAYHRTSDKNALEMANHTLDKMARGGIYDQLGGGFARYSTDEKWLVPHFEKMLYDNALLSWAYLEAFQISNRTEFAHIAAQTLDYVIRDMTDKEGGFFSAQDAGEVGKEGEYYVWTAGEAKKLLSAKEYSALTEAYGVSEGGNFEHGQNILNVAAKIAWPDLDRPELKSARAKLFQARLVRTPPHRDEKVLTAWNGLTISSLAKGYQVLGEEKYLIAAQSAAQFIKTKMFRNGRLIRRYALCSADIDGYLDDYSCLIEGLIHLYESDFDLKWLNWAKELQDIQDELFWDKENGGYFYSNAPELIVKKKDYMDNATPSGNSVALLNLLRLNAFFGQSKYINQFRKLLKAMSPLMSRYPGGFSRAAWAVEYYSDRAKEIAIVTPGNFNEAKPLLDWLHKSFLPNKVVALAPSEISDGAAPVLIQNKPALNDKIAYYICEAGTCKLPTNDIEKAKSLIIS